MASKKSKKKAAATTATVATSTPTTTASSTVVGRPKKGVPTDGQFENMHHRYINEAAYHSAAIFAYAFKQFELGMTMTTCAHVMASERYFLSIVNRGCIYWLFDSYEAAVRPNNENPPRFAYRGLALVEATEYKPVIDAVKAYDPRTTFVCLIAIRTGDRRDSLMKSVTLGRDAQSMVRTQSSFKTELTTGPFALWQKETLELKEGHHFCHAVLCDKYETKADEFKLCERCRYRVYCSRECQINHWKMSHKYGCKEEKVLHDQRQLRLAALALPPQPPAPKPAAVDTPSPATSAAATGETKATDASASTPPLDFVTAATLAAGDATAPVVTHATDADIEVADANAEGDDTTALEEVE